VSRASPQLAQSPPRLLTAKRRGSTRRGEKCGACASMNSITTKTTSCWTTKSYSVTTRGSAQPGHRPRLPPQAVEEALLGGQRGGRDGPSGCCSASATVMRGATGRPALWSARRARPPCCAATRATSRSGSNGAGLGDALRAGRDVRAGEHAPAARRWRPAAARRSPAAPPSGPGTTAPTADNPPPAARGPPATPPPRPSAGPCTRGSIRAICMRRAPAARRRSCGNRSARSRARSPRSPRSPRAPPSRTPAAAPPAPRSAPGTPRGADAQAPPRRTRGSDAARSRTASRRRASRPPVHPPKSPKSLRPPPMVEHLAASGRATPARRTALPRGRAVGQPAGRPLPRHGPPGAAQSRSGGLCWANGRRCS